jgi:hypothetical protein
MKKVLVINYPVQIAPGAVLDLSKEQAEARSLVVSSLGDDLYLVEQAALFKVGESFGYDGPVDKYLLGCLEGLAPPEETAPEEKHGSKKKNSGR